MQRRETSEGERVDIRRFDSDLQRLSARTASYLVAI